MDNQGFTGESGEGDIRSTEEDDVQRPRLFCELQCLKTQKDKTHIWQEKARWVKFKEEIEEGGWKWSKPYVATLPMKSLLKARDELQRSHVMLDVKVSSMLELTDLLLNALQKTNTFDDNTRRKIAELILTKHVHLHEGKKATKSDPHDTNRHNDVSVTPSRPAYKSQLCNLSVNELQEIDHCSARTLKPNKRFMRKVERGSEAAVVMVGEDECLAAPVSFFVRLEDSATMASMTEIAIGTKFVYIYLQPTNHDAQNPKYHVDIGNCMSTLFSDDIFKDSAYTATTKEDLMSAFDEFLDSIVALPPTQWDKKIRIEPPQKLPMKRQPSTATIIEEETHEEHGDPALKRTGRLFGGFIADIKRKLPWYKSDIIDGLHYQSIATIVYLYIASLTPIVTFGGLLGQATDNYMAAMEGIMAGAITGITFAIFAGQPMNIIGSTGPMLVFEKIIFSLCKSWNFNYLSFRLWTGLWCTVYLLLVVMFDLSSLVSFITRFTEESFAALIAIIFIVEAFEKLLKINEKSTINTHGKDLKSWVCNCVPDPNAGNTTEIPNTTQSSITSVWNSTINAVRDVSDGSCSPPISETECQSHGGKLEGPGCKYVPDVFLFSVLLFLGTFILEMVLRKFRNSPFFPSKVRQVVSDFGVILSIIIMVIIDAATGLDTLKLKVPNQFRPTRPDRGWFIHPFNNNPWWTALVAALPALFCTILIFLDQQITAVIINRKENKLKKGTGYHLDMFVVALQVGVCSVMGLPWFVASTVLAISHMMSMRKESESSAPGEKPQFLGIRENRLTALIMSILIGISVLLTVVFKLIPMAVLYGVFLYMGVSALNGVQLIDRILLVFKPAKYQPDFMYVRHVKTSRIHLFTLIQVLALAVLWVIKSFKETSIFFPIMIVAICFLRKLLDYVFNQRELGILDDILPEITKRKKEDSAIAETLKQNAHENGENGYVIGYDDKSGDVAYVGSYIKKDDTHL